MRDTVKVGDVFYTPDLFNGKVHKKEIIDVVDNKVTLLFDGTKCISYVSYYYERDGVYSTREEAQEQVDKEIERVKGLFTTPEKLLNYTYNKVLLPTNECSYEDIVAENCLTNLELREYESKCKEFFGITLIKEVDRNADME